MSPYLRNKKTGKRYKGYIKNGRTNYHYLLGYKRQYHEKSVAYPERKMNTTVNYLRNEVITLQVLKHTGLFSKDFLMGRLF